MKAYGNTRLLLMIVVLEEDKFFKGKNEKLASAGVVWSDS